MPRAHSEAEQGQIQATLLAEGRARFTEAGLLAVHVADLCQAAGIGKGTFYLFFPSKEALFFAIQEREEATHKAELMAALAVLAGRPAVAVVARYFTFQAEIWVRHPFLRWCADPGVRAALQGKLPAADLARHRAGDLAFVEGIARMWAAQGILPPETPPARLAALSATLMTMDADAETTRWIAHAFARHLVAPD